MTALCTTLLAPPRSCGSVKELLAPSCPLLASFESMPRSSRSLPAFSVCSGWDGVCPMKMSVGSGLDRGDVRCPFCDADSLSGALNSRSGQDTTAALLQIKPKSEQALNIALERLSRFDVADAGLRQDLEERVDRAAKRRGTKRRPAAATAVEPSDVAPASPESAKAAPPKPKQGNKSDQKTQADHDTESEDDSELERGRKGKGENKFSPGSFSDELVAALRLWPKPDIERASEEWQLHKEASLTVACPLLIS